MLVVVWSWWWFAPVSKPERWQSPVDRTLALALALALTLTLALALALALGLG